MKAIEKINALLLQHGKTGAEMSRDLGLSNSAYSLWNTGSTNPSVKNLKRIADYFGVNVSEIADDTEKENPVIVRDGNVKPELSEDERQLLTLYRSMNDAGRIALLAAANGFANSPAYTEDTSFVGVG